jgi:hypothetical protein
MATVKTNIANENGATPLSVAQGGTNQSSYFKGAIRFIAGNFATSATNIQNTPYTGANSLSSRSGQSPVFSGSSSTAISASNLQGYITTAGTLATITLPTSFAVGEQYAVQGQGAGKWTLKAGTGTTIQFLGSATSSGGSIAAAGRYDAVLVVGIVANTTWAVLNACTSGFVIT